MPVNRKLYKSHLTVDESPHWPCPKCGGGHYRLIKDSLHKRRTADARAVEKEEWFDAEHDETRFTALLECDNGNCREVATVAGKGWVEQWHGDFDESYYRDIFLPSFVSPSPAMITIPPKCPANVVEELERAFIASWSDFAAAGNHLRSVAERILDSLKVPKLITTARKTRQRLMLHNRIQRIEKTHPEVHDYLMAIKWLGNAGSHSNVLTREAVFDSMDILEAVMDKIYSKHPAALQVLVKKVIARRGPSR